MKYHTIPWTAVEVRLSDGDNYTSPARESVIVVNQIIGKRTLMGGLILFSPSPLEGEGWGGGDGICVGCRCSAVYGVGKDARVLMVAAFDFGNSLILFPRSGQSPPFFPRIVRRDRLV